MKKKVIMMSAAALIAANALTFGPVSYKIVDSAYAEPAPATGQATAAKINEVLAVVKDTPVLKTYVKNAATVADKYLGDPAFTNVENFFPGIVNPTDRTVVQGIINYVVATLQGHIADGGNNITDLGTIEAILAAQGITKEDAKALANDIIDYAVEQIDLENITDLFGSNVVEFALDNFGSFVSQEWSSSNTAIAYVNNLYGGEELDFIDDVNGAKTYIKDTITDVEEKKTLKYGTLALGMGLIKSELAKNVHTSTTSVTGGYKVGGLEVLGKKTPASMLIWTVNGDVKTVTSGEILSSTRSFRLTATLPASLLSSTSIPTELLELKLFDKSYGGSSGGGGGAIVDSGPLKLVTDAIVIADGIDKKVEEFLAGDVDLATNKDLNALKTLIEDQLRDALTVPSTSKLTVIDGVSTLELTVADLDYIFTEQLNHVLTQAIKAFEDATGSKDLKPVMTFDLGAAVTNSNVKLSAQVLSALEAKGITTVGVKAGGAIVEVPLAELVGATSIAVKKSDRDIAGLQAGAKQLSNIYSVQVLDANGKEISAFPGQYRLAIASSNTVNTTMLSLAKVTGDSITLVGGNYNAANRNVATYRSGFSEYAVVESNVSFNDTAALAWAEKDIELAASKGIILGKADGIFDPRANVTRAEFTAMIVRALGVESDIHSENFDDVSDLAWYQSVVASATANGIINGRTNTSFDPNANITREEMATITANALKSVLDYKTAGVEAALASFTDADKFAGAHKEGIALVAQEGIVQGKGNGVYDPKGTATRAEAAVIIAKLIELR